MARIETGRVSPQVRPRGEEERTNTDLGHRGTLGSVLLVVYCASREIRCTREHKHE
jgi:hypothetical protein